MEVVSVELNQEERETVERHFSESSKVYFLLDIIVLLCDCDCYLLLITGAGSGAHIPAHSHIPAHLSPAAVESAGGEGTGG